MATKIVDFHEYCPTCKFHDTQAFEDPCNECLNSPVNEDSHKPINWKKAKEKKGKKHD